MYMTISHIRTSSADIHAGLHLVTQPSKCSYMNLSNTNKDCPRATASHPAKQFSFLILVININSAILEQQHCLVSLSH